MPCKGTYSFLGQSLVRGGTLSTSLEAEDRNTDSFRSSAPHPALRPGCVIPQFINLHLKLVFVDPEALDLRLQGRSWHSEFPCRPGGARNPPPAFIESRFDQFPLPVVFR